MHVYEVFGFKKKHSFQSQLQLVIKGIKTSLYLDPSGVSKVNNDFQYDQLCETFTCVGQKHWALGIKGL